MKVSIVLAAAAALLATASPLEKRKYAVHKVVATVTEFRYPDGSLAKPTGRRGGWRNHRRPHDRPGRPEAKPTAAPAPPAPKPEEAPPAKELPKVPEIGLPFPDQGEDKPSYAPPSAPAGDDEVSSALYSTNLHRANHSAPAVVWDDDLANSAAVLASRCNFKHDTKIGGGGYGQNLAYAGSSGRLPSPGTAIAQAISNWYNGEFFKFPYFGVEPLMSDFTEWGHLTALLWKGTERMGCSCQLCPAGTLESGFDVWNTVCNYGPSGNYDGQYSDNVGFPLGNAPYIV